MMQNTNKRNSIMQTELLRKKFSLMCKTHEIFYMDCYNFFSIVKLDNVLFEEILLIKKLLRHYKNLWLLV